MKNLSKNFSFSDMIKSIKNYFSSNRENIWVFVAIIAISFFSSLNIASGLNFSISDTTSVNDAVTFHETVEKANTVENKVTTKLASVKTSGSSNKPVSASRSPKHFDFTGASYENVGYGSGRASTCKYKDSKGKCILNTPNTGIAQYRSCQTCKPFLYGHNTSNFRVLSSMQAGDTFAVKVDGINKTYRVVKNFTLSNADANASAASIYKSTYNGDFDITLQTCVGSSNATVRYIQAIAV